MRRIIVPFLIGISMICALRYVRAAESANSEQARKSVNLSLPLLKKSLAEYPHHAACFSCHHQGVGLFALSLARANGYPVDESVLKAVSQHAEADLRGDLAAYKKGQGQPGGVTRAGYALLALQSGGVKQNEITSAVASFLLQRDSDMGYWRSASNRPPQEHSSFTDTFLAVRALNAYSEKTQKALVSARITQARQWLEKTTPIDTEDKVFRLWAMKETGSTVKLIQEAADSLAAEQREDGGWAQLPGMKSDAYATGSVLTVLSLVGGVAANTSGYQRGIKYLIDTQLPDGSWHVVSRSKPFQPYFESGFPHGKDQFISMAASSWATSALILTAPMKPANQ